MLGRIAARTRWSGTHLVRAAALGAAVTITLSGCTGGDVPENPGSASPSATTGTSTPHTPATDDTPAAEVTVEFEHAVPEDPCPPVSELTLPPAPDGYSYGMGETFVSDDEHPDGSAREISVACRYQLDGIEDATVVSDDTVSIRIWVFLFPSLHNRRLDRPLPVASGDLDDWASATLPHSRDHGADQEACGSVADPIPCADNEEPTVQTSAVTISMRGNVGNALFDMLGGTYTAVTMPPDVEETMVRIFREFVLAVVATWERAD